MNSPAICSEVDPGPPQKPYINTRLLLLGVLLGFGFCVLKGHLVSQHSYIENYKRFGRYIAPETNYYPTVRQMRNLVNTKLHSSPNNQAVIVIIGGDSIFEGMGQSFNHLWSDHLQKSLGINYCVVNLAMRGSAPTGGAECVAEYFLKQKKPVIYISDVGRSAMSPFGSALYCYQYWQAFEAGFLFHNPAREALAQQKKESENEILRAELSEYLRFDDMWNYISYKYLNTTWSVLTQDSWWSPHSAFLDADTGNRLAVPDRFCIEDTPEHAKELVASFSGNYYAKDVNGKWKETHAWAELTQAFANSFVPEMRAHTLFVRVQYAPYVVALLSAEEQQREKMCIEGMVLHLSSLGFSVIRYGDTFTNLDYNDLWHLRGAGGDKLAEILAPVVLTLGNKLYGTNPIPQSVQTDPDN